ncbi:phosphopyruvate hydratase [candidate division KSB1 bacterium]|nr:phosphopyruvate hydratase [candidate division KSB1 bacterium]
MKGSIKRITAREVFTTKGVPTIEVDVVLDDDSLGRSAAPGGTSRGEYESFDLIDGDKSYFDGKGVSKAISIVHDTIAEKLVDQNAYDQENIDNILIKLDGTEKKSQLGGNTIIAVSIACAKAAACSKGMELFKYLGGGNEIPLPLVYVMFGGPAYVSLSGICDFQEYALIPLKAKNYKSGYISTLGIYKKLCEIMTAKTGYGTAHYSKIAGIPIARFDTNEEAFAILTQLIKDEGYEPWDEFGIHVDIAANQLYRNGLYYLDCNKAVFSRTQMIDWLVKLCGEYPIVSLEDPLFEDDWEGWKILTEKIGNKVQILGDDLFVTNKKRLEKGITMGAANAIVIKPNQVGTLTETFQTIKTAKAANYGTVVSPRSGELWDPYLVHLCVGQNLGQGKIAGAYSSGESSVNELIRIGDSLSDRAMYRDGSILPQNR